MQDEIKAALAEQEEHIMRWKSCREVVGTAHAFRESGRPGNPPVLYSACVVCGVTETVEDYRKKVS